MAAAMQKEGLAHIETFLGCAKSAIPELGGPIIFLACDLSCDQLSENRHALGLGLGMTVIVLFHFT